MKANGAKALGKFRTRFTVYRLECRAYGGYDDAGGTETFVSADFASVNLLFTAEPELAQRFLRFVDRGHRGFFLVHDNQWAAYGWFSRPEGAPPGHLPRWVMRLGGCWIFYCRTKRAFRGRGLFGSLLEHMIQTIHRERTAPLIYIDTLAQNIPSRRAILSAGFVPCGLITTHQLWLPRIGSLRLASSWQREETHPPVLGPAPQSLSLTSTQ